MSKRFQCSGTHFGSSTDAAVETIRTGINDTLRRLIRVRERFNKPMVINSGYRCRDHCASIGSTMTHTTGQAVDVSVAGGQDHTTLRNEFDSFCI
ncbi:D-Ala-D-Ala carboxypeptidase family metallohydrolase [Microbulbifer sp. 2304DJ12-6]|uniref:D-Ala-D-Ala carboxypeptidase family metallohydrolase n=1 Tax=Microbulbifer sp. 2304DJ12-6 TaxID=3233340 RepID=UPI0039AF2FB3